MLVLRIGVNAVLLTPENSQCERTATELYRSSRVFVLVSLIAWVIIIVGYLIPFFVVAFLLTRNGYSPTNDANTRHGDSNFGVFPLSSYGRNAAPPDCIDRLNIVSFEELRPHDAKECCVSHFILLCACYVLKCVTNFAIQCFIYLRYVCQNLFLMKRLFRRNATTFSIRSAVKSG